MFILNDYEGTAVSIDFYNGDLHAVLSLLSDAARIDGYDMVVDRQIKGKIQIKMYEPWNHILVEILAGVNFAAMVVKKSIIISFNNSSSGSQVN